MTLLCKISAEGHNQTCSVSVQVEQYRVLIFRESALLGTPNKKSDLGSNS